MNDERHDESHDDTGAERDEETGTAPGVIDEIRADEPEPTSGGTDCPIDAQRDFDVEGRCRSEAAHPEITAQVIASLMQMGVSESYSGMLPRPDDFNKYPIDVQERMCRWSDAFTSDESERQNQLVAAEITQARKGMWVSAALFLIAMLFSLAAYLVTVSPWSFGFLAVPVVSMIVNLFEPISSRSSASHGGMDKKKQSDARGNGGESSHDDSQG